MAVRYVKDFEFPSKAGYTKSATKVTGQMYAKGGKVCKAEGGGVSDAERSMLQRMAEEADSTTQAERTMGGGSTSSSERGVTKSAKKPASKKGSPYVPNTNIPYDAIYEKGTGPTYKKGGKVAKVMGEFKEGKLHSGSKKGPEVTSRKQAVAIALSEAGKSKKAKGGKVSSMEWEHSKEDLAQDRRLAKKHGMSLEAWEKSDLDKKHDSQQSPKGLKKGGYADGGPAAAPQSALQRMAMAPRNPGMRAKGVPVAPKAPVIQPPSMGQRGIGVGQKRPGGPNVGVIRSLMSKASSQANPAASPAVMKKGGKVKGC